MVLTSEQVKSKARKSTSHSEVGGGGQDKETGEIKFWTQGGCVVLLGDHTIGCVGVGWRWKDFKCRFEVRRFKLRGGSWWAAAINAGKVSWMVNLQALYDNRHIV